MRRTGTKRHNNFLLDLLGCAMVFWVTIASLAKRLRALAS